MRPFFKFLWQLFFNFATLVTGGVLGLYYTLIAPSIEAFQLKAALDFGIPFLGFLAACFLTWKNLYDENRQLRKKIAKLEDDRPKYKLKVVDEAHVLDDVLAELEAERTKAEMKKAEAPQPSAWSIQFPSVIGGELTENDWAEYIDELDKFKIERLGSRREIHKEKKDLLSVEYDIMRGGDEFRLHYNPIFVKPTSDDPMQIRYCFKSDKLTKTSEKVLVIS